MKVTLVIPIYNRTEYVAQCFDSIIEASLPGDLQIILVDDASIDESLPGVITHFFEELDERKIMHCLITHDVNTGVSGSLKDGIELAFKEGCDIVINLDSDAIVKADFVQKLISLQNGLPHCISSGFNCISESNPIINKPFKDCVTKAFANGINMCFNLTQYEKYIKPSLDKYGNWDYNTSLACQVDNLPFIITSPSVVQHIGMVSSMGHYHSAGADRAQDFKRISLPDVTLFGIDSHDIKGIERAATISQYDVEFGAVNIITADLFTKGGSNETRRNDYSRFMLKELTKYFDTSHVLTTHADGYVLNWRGWSEEYLKYDYIGATWLYKDGKNVGNGGFSLRSKKLCDILANNFIEPEHMHPEDHCICRTYRKSLEDNFGIKFAPEDVANKFSIEAYGSAAIKDANKYCGQFGFHSSHIDFSDSGLPKDILYSKPQPTNINQGQPSRIDTIRNNMLKQQR
jgi:glycosyltransferase involved in cell wall biosynthesis